MVSLVSRFMNDYEKAPACTILPRRDDSQPIKAVQYQGTEKMVVGTVGKPLVTDDQDVILRVTSTCICGSDLHIYNGVMPGMKAGDIMGHEFMGIVEDVGPAVKSFQKGDRVVACFDIGCGSCFYCKQQLFSCCNQTNPSKEERALYGHNTAGFYGYSRMTGNWPGGQAEYQRVPLAETNLMKLDPDMEEDAAVLLSDILPTAWHANELAGVGEGDRVAIWGAGPVGQLAVMCAFARGASRVISIDSEQYRLDFLSTHSPKVETINFKEKDTLTALREMFPDGTAPDCCIEAVGFHYTKTWTHWLEMAIKAETDPSEMLNEIIEACRCGGRIGVVGVYAGYTNHYNIGAFMEKGLRMAAGQTPCQKYWHKLRELIQEGKLNPAAVVTHRLPLADAPRGYKVFNDKLEGCIKVVLKPSLSASEQ